MEREREREITAYRIAPSGENSVLPVLRKRWSFTAQPIAGENLLIFSLLILLLRVVCPAAKQQPKQRGLAVMMFSARTSFIEKRCLRGHGRTACRCSYKWKQPHDGAEPGAAAVPVSCPG